MMSRWQSQRNQTSLQLLGFFYGYIVGLEGACGLRSDQPWRRRVSKGDEFNKLHRRRRSQPLLRQQQGRMVPAPPTSLPRLRPVRPWARPVKATLYMAFKYCISFAIDLAANFGCNWFRTMTDIVSKFLRKAIRSRCAVLFESEQTPFSWTGRRLRSAALHRIRFGTYWFIPVSYFYSEPRRPTDFAVKTFDCLLE